MKGSNSSEGFLCRSEQDKFVAKWNGGEQTPTIDAAIRDVIRSFPGHDEIKHVLPKVILIDELYHARLPNGFAMAQHIVSLNSVSPIANMLEMGDDNVVAKIAACSFNGKSTCCYCFATKYCSFHCPDMYPIYDSIVDGYLWKNRSKIGYKFKRKSLKSYGEYRKIIDHCIEKFGLEKDYKKVDEYLWQLGGGKIN